MKIVQILIKSTTCNEVLVHLKNIESHVTGCTH